MASFEESMQQARRISDTFGMRPSVRNNEVIIAEGDQEQFYWVTPVGGETRTMKPSELRTFLAANQQNNWEI